MGLEYLRIREMAEIEEKFGWETEEERLKRYMKIPAKKKLEWLYEMNQLAQRLPRKTRRIRLKLKKQQNRA